MASCAADGASKLEAIKNVELAITQWIATARELGREIPQPKGRLLFA